MKVSAIIPSYNRVDTLPRAIDSVLGQTYPVSELVVVNDCSTDGTRSYLDTLADPRITIIHFNENKGGCVTRNKGASVSTGDFLAFLDDDDEWKPNKIERQISMIETKKADFCFTAKEIITFDGNRSISYHKPKGNLLKRAIMKDNFIGGTSSILVRRTLFNQITGFDPYLPALQDYDLYIRLINHNAVTVGINEPLVIYNIRYPDQNISCGFNEFRTAAHYLVSKYKDNQYITDLRIGLITIALRRLLKSRRFLKEAIQYTFHKKHSQYKKVR